MIMDISKFHKHANCHFRDIPEYSVIFRNVFRENPGISRKPVPGISVQILGNSGKFPEFPGKSVRSQEFPEIPRNPGKISEWLSFGNSGNFRTNENSGKFREFPGISCNVHTWTFREFPGISRNWNFREFPGIPRDFPEFYELLWTFFGIKYM